MNPLARYLDPEVVRSVGQLDLRARVIVEGFLAGLHASPLRGYSVEFSEHRKYVHGDEPRTIDWKVFARTDRLFVRQYEAETHLDCHLLVDTSASMGPVGTFGGEDAPAAKLQYAVHLAAALGYLVTRQRDAVSLGLLGDGLSAWLPARSRRQHLVRLLTLLAGVRPAGPTGLVRGLTGALAQIRHRGLIVLISDLLTETEALLRALHHARHRGHDLIVMHVLDAVEAHFDLQGAVRLEDPESGTLVQVDAPAVAERYRAALDAWRAELRQQILAARGDYVALDTSVPFDKALVEFLTQRQRRR